MRRPRCRSGYWFYLSLLIEANRMWTVASAFVALFTRLFSATKVTFVIWWILGLAAEWVDEET
jgi:hypothetical protein